MKDSSIHIFYRHYDTENVGPAHTTGNGRIPSWFCFEKCFLSLFETIKKNKNIHLHVMMDSLEPEKNFIYKYKNSVSINIIDTKGCVNDHLDLAHDLIKIQPNKKHNNTTVLSKINYPVSRDYLSVRETLKYIKGLDLQPEDRIFICENDYIFVDDWVAKVNLIYQDYPLLTASNYVTPTDARFKYGMLHENVLKGKITDHPKFSKFNLLSTGTKNIDNWKNGILPHESHHWIVNIPYGTPHSISTKKMFDKDFDIIYKTVCDNRVWDRLYSENNRLLISPIPGLSCHVMNKQLSPGVNWEKISSRIFRI